MWSGTSKPKESLRKKKEKESAEGMRKTACISNYLMPFYLSTFAQEFWIRVVFIQLPPKYLDLFIMHWSTCQPRMCCQRSPQGISILLALGEYMQQNSVVEWLNAAFIWCLRRTVKGWASLKEFEKTGIHQLADCISIYYISQMKDTHGVTVITMG